MRPPMAAPDNKTRNVKRRNPPRRGAQKSPARASIRPRCGAGKTQGEDDVFCLSQRVANEQRHRRRNKEASRCARPRRARSAALCLLPRWSGSSCCVVSARSRGCGRCRRRRRVYLRSRGRGFLPRKSVCRRCQRGMRHVPLQQPRSAASTRYISAPDRRRASRSG